MKTQNLMAAICVLIISTQPLSGSVLYEFTALKWDLNWNSGPDNSTQREYHLEAGLPFKLEVFKLGDNDPATYVVTVPRFRNASLIPAGLNTLSPPANNKMGLLRPFPNWESNRLGNCDSLQSPTGLVVGRNRYLYVIDTGRVDVVTPSPRNLCPAKLVVFSLTGQLVDSYEFPDSVVSRTQNFLTDIVLDYISTDYVTDPKFAYISDINSGGRIVVFDFTDNTSWAVSDTKAYPQRELKIHGRDYLRIQNFPSLSLTPDFNFIYYSVTGSSSLWQIKTWILRSPTSVHPWRRIDLPYNIGVLAATSSELYNGVLELDAIMRWKTGQDMTDQKTTEGSVIIRTNSPELQNWETLVWTSALRIFKETWYLTNVYYLSNKAHLFLTGNMNFTAPQINFRLGYI